VGRRSVVVVGGQASAFSHHPAGLEDPTLHDNEASEARALASRCHLSDNSSLGQAEARSQSSPKSSVQ